MLRSSEVAELLGLSRATVEGLSTYMGHASVTLTLDRYGHMFPGNEGEAAGLLEAFLQRATGAQTGAHLRQSASSRETRPEAAGYGSRRP